MKIWYTKQGLWTLFLMCAVLLHLWALMLIFRDMSWVTERSNAWDALGVAAYGLVFTLVESAGLFLCAVLMGFLTPKKWSVDKRVAFLSLLVLLAALWAILGQLGFLVNFTPPEAIMRSLAESGHPVRNMYIFALIIVTLSVLLPAFWMARAERAVETARPVIDRLSVLAVFYLVFDAIGLIVLVIRNVA